MYRSEVLGARMRGLPGDLADYLFRHLYGLLPTQDRVAAMGASRGERAEGVCRGCEPDTPDSLLHSLHGCAPTAAASAALLACLQAAVPGATPKSALLLNLDLRPVLCTVYCPKSSNLGKLMLSNSCLLR